MIVEHETRKHVLDKTFQHEKPTDKLLINAIQLKYPEVDIIKVGCSHHKKQGYYPIKSDNILECDTKISADWLYTRFEEVSENAPLCVELAIKNNPHLLKHYYQRQLEDALKTVSDVMMSDFVGRFKIFLKSKSIKEEDIIVYKSFAIEVQVPGFGKTPRLLISYDGEMIQSHKSVMDIPAASINYVNRVVYRGRVYVYNSLSQLRSIRNEEVFPILNRNLKQALNVSYRTPKPLNRLDNYINAITEVLNILKGNKEFESQFPYVRKNATFLNVSHNEMGIINPKNREIRFGGDGISKQDRQFSNEFKGNGAYRRPPLSHLNIVGVAEVGRGENRWSILKNNLLGLKSFLNMPVNCYEACITFDRSLNVPADRQIRQKILELRAKGVNVHVAFCISPYNRVEQNEQNRQLYYEIKKAFREVNLPSSCIWIDNVTNPNFKYFLPNLSAKVIARTGGIPWISANGTNDSLVIGINAYRNRKRLKPYIATACAYSEMEGRFLFDAHEQTDIRLLTSSILKMVERFTGESEGYERIVIHFYKQLSFEERNEILDALNALKTPVKLYIVMINKLQSTESIFWDSRNYNRLPVMGTYVRQHDGTYLLALNQRTSKRQEKVSSYPFPMKIRVWSVTDERINEKEEKALLAQIVRYSNLNWRSITPSTQPVTVTFPARLAKLAAHTPGGFDTIHNSNLIEI